MNGIAAVPLAADDLGKAVTPEPANLSNGSYPLGRPLFITVPDPRDRPLPVSLLEFVRFIYSREGQEIVDRDGYVPVSRTIAAKAAERLGLRLPE